MASPDGNSMTACPPAAGSTALNLDELVERKVVLVVDTNVLINELGDFTTLQSVADSATVVVPYTGEFVCARNG